MRAASPALSKDCSVILHGAVPRSTSYYVRSMYSVRVTDFLQCEIHGCVCALQSGPIAYNSTFGAEPSWTTHCRASSATSRDSSLIIISSCVLYPYYVRSTECARCCYTDTSYVDSPHSSAYTVTHNHIRSSLQHSLLAASGQLRFCYTSYVRSTPYFSGSLRLLSWHI
jgi:hypothetical protein